MVNTRANSYTGELPVPTVAVMATTTTTLSTAPTTTVVTTTTTTTAGTPVMSSSAPEISNSLSSSLNQPTPETPHFSSLTAQNIQRERREQVENNLGNTRRRIESNPETQLHDVINSAIGVGQMELIRLLDERLKLLVPQLVQQSLDVRLQTSNQLTQNVGQPAHLHSNQTAPAAATLNLPQETNIQISGEATQSGDLRAGNLMPPTPNVRYLQFTNHASPVNPVDTHSSQQINPVLQQRPTLSQGNLQAHGHPPSVSPRQGTKRMEIEK